jgi:hypothetical protein
MAAADGAAAPEGEWRGGKAASAISKDVKTLFTNEQIAAILPHRYPFLLVDKVVEFDAGKRAVGIKQVGRCVRAPQKRGGVLRLGRADVPPRKKSARRGFGVGRGFHH